MAYGLREKNGLRVTRKNWLTGYVGEKLSLRIHEEKRES